MSCMVFQSTNKSNPQPLNNIHQLLNQLPSQSSPSSTIPKQSNIQRSQMGREHPHSTSFKKTSINFVLNTPDVSMDLNAPSTRKQQVISQYSPINNLNQLAHVASSMYDHQSDTPSSSNTASANSSTIVASNSSIHNNHMMQTSNVVDDTPRPSRRIRKRINVSCDECGRVFGDSSSLKKHIRVVHRKVKDFRCDMCGKTFAEKSNRSKHIIAAHLNQRSHPCDMCDKVFNFTDGLKRHKNNVHLGIRPYQCEDCQRWYKQKTHLLKHRQSVHGVPLPPPTRRNK